MTEAQGATQIQDLPHPALAAFYAYLPRHTYIHVPTRELWTGESINALVQVGKKSTRATTWLDQNRGVELITYAPGRPMLIEDEYCIDGGWRQHPGARTFNLYTPPEILRDLNLSTIDADMAAWLAKRWLNAIRETWPDEANEIVLYCAYVVQHPGIKINHMLLLGGLPGGGKDLLMEPFRRAVGESNFAEATPEQVMGQFTDYQRCVVLRINELKDNGEIDGRKLYNRLKWISASPPETRKINEKHLRPYYIPNVGGVIATTNYRTGALFPESDDRRIFACWSERGVDSFPAGYFDALGHWYKHGAQDGIPLNGFQRVAIYLTKLDISTFNPYRPPRKTPAFFALLESSMPPETARLADLLDAMGTPIPGTSNRVPPAMVTLDQIKEAAGRPPVPPNDPRTGVLNWLNERKNWNTIPHRLAECGYTRVHNDRAKDGLWKIANRRQVVYAHRDLAREQQGTWVEQLDKTGQPVLFAPPAT